MNIKKWLVQLLNLGLEKETSTPQIAPAPPATTQEELEKEVVKRFNFLFEETGREYFRRIAELEKFAAEKVKEKEEEAKRLRAQAEEIEAGGTSPAEKELLRRQALGIIERDVRNVLLKGNYIAGRAKEDVGQLPLVLRQEELQKIAHAGRIVCSSGLIPDKKGWEKNERRVVTYTDGRVFLCALTYPTIPRETGRMVEEGYGYYNRYTRTVPEMEPTENFGPPTVEWVTTSLEQFTEEELKALL